MKSRVEGSKSKAPVCSQTGRTVGRATAGLVGVSLLAACGPQVHDRQQFTQQEPQIQVERLDTLQKPAPRLDAGKFVTAFVCMGYVAHDGNRWVINPIVDEAQAEQGKYTPMTVTHHDGQLDINPSMPQENLVYYDQNNKPLPRGQKPTCNTVWLKVAQIKTDFPNVVDPKAPNEIVHYTSADAYTDANYDINDVPTYGSWKEPKDPNHVYGTNLAQDSLTRRDLVNFEGTF